MKFLKQLFARKSKIPRTDVTRRFDLIGRVGQGSMSKVWRARDTMTGRMVALKVLDLEKTRRLEARFTGLNKPTEGEVAVGLDHPHIVRTFEHGLTRQGEQFLVMEFIEGVGLSFLVDMQNELMRNNRLRLMIELGEAVQYFHQQNWIHRDICPRNVLVDQDNGIKLIDFGLVVPNTPPFRKPGNRTGTANYMAPELIKRLRTDQRIDIFSFSITCYEMFTKRYPWEAGMTLDMAIQHINKPPTDIRDLVPDIDEQVAETIMRGLERDPNDRWPSMGRMLAPLREAQSRLEPSTATSSSTRGPSA
jgi:eukaryotic-like serine/threonine-protein kinase